MSRCTASINSNLPRPNQSSVTQDLLTASIGGKDHESFRELVSRHQIQLERIAGRFVGCEFAQDVVQEVFRKIAEGKIGFNPESGNARQYLYSCTVNQARDFLRRLKKDALTHSVSTDQENTLNNTIALSDTRSSSPIETLMQKEVATFLQECVAELPELERSAIRSFYWEGQGTSEYSREIGIPNATVKSRKHQGIAKLRSAYRRAFKA